MTETKTQAATDKARRAERAARREARGFQAESAELDRAEAGRAVNSHTALVAALRDTLALARLKWGNLDPDANGIFAIADAVLSAEGEKDAPKDDGWIEWKGGECPVPGDTMVEVLLREETATTGEAMEAGKYSWGHFGEGNRYADHDIVSYRVVKP